MKKLDPIHPGEVLMKDFIEPVGITQHKVAVAIGVPPRRINEIVPGKRRITADTALRLARYFGTTESGAFLDGTLGASEGGTRCRHPRPFPGKSGTKPANGSW